MSWSTSNLCVDTSSTVILLPQPVTFCSLARASHLILNFCIIATKNGWALAAPIGILVHVFFPVGTKKAVFPFDASVSSTCQQPQCRSIVMKKLASPILSMALSHLGAGKVNGCALELRLRHDTQNLNTHSDQWTCSWFGFVANAATAPQGPSSSSMIPLSSEPLTRMLMA